MKTLTLFLLFATACLTQQGKADESTSVYSALVKIQTVDTVYSYPATEQSPYQMDLGSRRAGRDSERRTGPAIAGQDFGWQPLRPEPRTKIEQTGATTPEAPATTGQATEAAPGLQVAPYTGPKLGHNELPYIDAEGNQLKNYGIMLTAKWCRWCPIMYENTIKPLREEGYKIYVIDVDDFPDIKDRIYRLDPTAQKMGRGVPYFVVREGGETKKIYFGYTEPHVVRPHLKKHAEQPDNPYDLK
jgi:hypothetical protein